MLDLPELDERWSKIRDEALEVLRRPDVVPMAGDWIRAKHNGHTEYAACAVGAWALAKALQVEPGTVRWEGIEDFIEQCGLTRDDMENMSDGYEHSSWEDQEELNEYLEYFEERNFNTQAFLTGVWIRQTIESEKEVRHEYDAIERGFRDQYSWYDTGRDLPVLESLETA